MNILQQKIEINSKVWLYVTVVPTIVSTLWTMYFIYSLAFSNRHTTGESMMQGFTIVFAGISVLLALVALETSSQKRALGAACFALLTIGLIGGYTIGRMPRPDYGGESQSYDASLVEQGTE